MDYYYQNQPAMSDNARTAIIVIVVIIALFLLYSLFWTSAPRNDSRRNEDMTAQEYLENARVKLDRLGRDGAMYARQLLDKTSKTYSEAKAESEDWKQRARSKAENAWEDAKTKTQHLKEEGEEYLDRLRSQGKIADQRAEEYVQKLHSVGDEDVNRAEEYVRQIKEEAGADYNQYHGEEYLNKVKAGASKIGAEIKSKWNQYTKPEDNHETFAGVNDYYNNAEETGASDNSNQMMWNGAENSQKYDEEQMVDVMTREKQRLESSMGRPMSETEVQTLIRDINRPNGQMMNAQCGYINGNSNGSSNGKRSGKNGKNGKAILGYDSSEDSYAAAK